MKIIKNHWHVKNDIEVVIFKKKFKIKLEL